MPHKLIKRLMENPGTILREVALVSAPPQKPSGKRAHYLRVVLENEIWGEHVNRTGAYAAMDADAKADRVIYQSEGAFVSPEKLRLMFRGPKQNLERAQTQIQGLVISPSGSKAFQHELDAWLARGKPKKDK